MDYLGSLQRYYHHIFWPTAPSGSRRITWLTALFGTSLLLCGCLRRAPRGVAERYIESLQQFNYQECYSLLSQQDRLDRTLQQFLTEIPLAPDVSPIWFRPVLHNTRYELGAEHRDAGGTTAFVPVRVTTLDLPLWERTLNASAGADASPGELAQRSLETGGYPTVTYEDKIFLVKDHHHWRVAAGFVGRDRVLDRHRAAIADFYDGRLDQVIAEYRSMIAELEQLSGTGDAGLAQRFKAELAQAIKAKAELPEGSSYRPKLVLSDVAMRMSEEHVPAIFGTATNSGKRPIDQLRLAVTWYQGRGKDLKIVHREEHPIVLTPIEFTDFSQQVIPFLPGETRRFGFTLNAPVAVQQAAAPYVTIAWIGFTQSQAPLPKLEHASGSRPSGHAGTALAAAAPGHDKSPTRLAAPQIAVRHGTGMTVPPASPN